MHGKQPRIYILDQGDCIAHCVQRILNTNNRDDVVIHMERYEELLVSLQSRDYVGSKPVIVIGDVQSKQYADKFSLFEDFATTAHIPVIVVGCAHFGWLIRRFLDSPNVYGYLHDTDRWEMFLLAAVNQVRQHKKYLSPTAEEMVKHSRRRHARKRRFAKPEIITLTGLRQDKAPCEIAEQFGVDRRTIYDAMERLRYLFGTKQTSSMLAASEKSGIYCHKTDSD